jgi:hypothetical protein
MSRNVRPTCAPVKECARRSRAGHAYERPSRRNRDAANREASRLARLGGALADLETPSFRLRSTSGGIDIASRSVGRPLSPRKKTDDFPAKTPTAVSKISPRTGSISEDGRGLGESRDGAGKAFEPVQMAGKPNDIACLRKRLR